MQTHTDKIWISEPRERQTVKTLVEHVQSCGYTPTVQDSNQNFGFPYVFAKDGKALACRLVDLAEDTDIVITDNHPLQPTTGKRISVLPEFWGQWHFEPEYEDRDSSISYNCFMNRERGDRDRVFALLKQRNILDKGSRPWLLYCSPFSIELLRSHGFDVLDDMIDTTYDTEKNHWMRLDIILDQLETFIDRQYTPKDYQRFKQAATHNQQLLASLLHGWPEKLKTVMSCLTP
jgi:hypothetical protein